MQLTFLVSLDCCVFNCLKLMKRIRKCQGLHCGGVQDAAAGEWSTSTGQAMIPTSHGDAVNYCDDWCVGHAR